MSRDLIDRQEILDRLDRVIIRGVYDDFYEGHLLTAEAVKETILSLPSAQPEPTSCKQVTGKLDLISRQDAIDAVEHITSSMSVCVNTDECHGMKRMQRQAVIELANLPSAQPDKEIPRRVLWSGWKGTRYTRYKCPNCNKPVKNDDVYCHRCGQKLMFPHISHTPYIEGEKQELIVRWDDEE